MSSNPVDRGGDEADAWKKGSSEFVVKRGNAPETLKPAADNISGTSEVPNLADPLCASRKSAEVGQARDSCDAFLAFRAILAMRAVPPGRLFAMGCN
jgi:hypothetical protein